MGVYDYISSIALMTYFFMFLIILNSKRTKISNIFLGMMVISMFWTGGSLLMRKQFFPSYVLWYHVSLGGLMYLPIVYFRFIMEFTRNVKRGVIHIYTILMTALFAVNIVTEWFLAPPSIVMQNSVEVMVYDAVEWPVYILVALFAVLVSHMLGYFIIEMKKNPTFRRLSQPLIFGVVVTFVGNLMLLIPAFSAFPIDIVAGLVLAGSLLYALAKKSPFRLKMVLSESVGYIICLTLSLVTLLLLHPMLTRVLTSNSITSGSSIMWYLTVYTVLLAAYFIAWRLIVMGIFVKEEEEKSEFLNVFNANITKTLNTDKIFRQTMTAIEKVSGKFDVYVALKSDQNSYKLQISNQPLADLTVEFRADNPLIKRVKEQRAGIEIEHFRYDTNYQTMWEVEKFELVKLGITHAFGLIHDNDLLGVMFISDSGYRTKLKPQHMIEIQSICTMVSIAIKNAASYERAIIESRTDDLTGMYNRKYFYKLIEEQFQIYRNKELSLAMINIDDFKLYNQLYGEKKADQALKVVAEIIQGTVGANGYVARFSGKEFAIILPKFDVYRTTEFIDKIRNQIETVSKGTSKRLERNLTTSVGICVHPYGATNVHELIENVQQAVYQIKRNGKNNIRVFETFIKAETEVEKIPYSEIYDEYKSTIFALTAAIDAKDHYTFSHSDNVANYAVTFAKELSLNDDIVENIRQAALLHDIGKISIPEQILNKPGRLSDEELVIMQGHVDASIDIIRHLPSLDYVIPAVLGHHERWDGRGYPRRSRGEDIPLTARILCLADSFDAMISKRVYKDEQPLENVLKIIESEAGKQFDPRLAGKFVDMVRAGKLTVEVQVLPKTTTQTEVKTDEVYSVV